MYVDDYYEKNYLNIPIVILQTNKQTTSEHTHTDNWQSLFLQVYVCVEFEKSFFFFKNFTSFNMMDVWMNKVNLQKTTTITIENENPVLSL